MAIVGLRYMTVMSFDAGTHYVGAESIDYSVYNLLFTVVFAAGMGGTLSAGYVRFFGHKRISSIALFLSALLPCVLCQCRQYCSGFYLDCYAGRLLYAADTVVRFFSHGCFRNKGMASALL
jgi:hypothetical protein